MTQGSRLPARAGLLPLDLRSLEVSTEDLARLLRDPSARFGKEKLEVLQALNFGAAQSDCRLFEMVAGIAYIPIRGTLFNDDWIDPFWGWSGYKGLSAQLAAAMADPEVKAILFDIKSPGGVADGVFDLSDEIFAARGQGKPIWAMANSMALSAAYAIASAAEFIFLPRLAVVGSIGVWTMHVDQSKFLEEVGFKVTLVFSGGHKVDGHPFAPLPPAVEAEMKRRVDRTRLLFAETVARNRSLELQAVMDTEARVYEDQEAIAAGLADGVATDKVVVAALLEELAGTASVSAA